MHLYLHPIPGSFDDFIGASKPNGYRWLHTCAWLSDRQPIEIQIRTREMHEQADYGSAAHWWYKHAEDPFLGAASSES